MKPPNFCPFCQNKLVRNKMLDANLCKNLCFNYLKKGNVGHFTMNKIPGRIFFNTNYIFVYQDINNPASFQFEHLDELFEKLNFIATFS